MGLLNKAVETYDCHRAYAGVAREGHEMLLPIAHIAAKAQIEITLDPDGKCVEARAVDQSEGKIAIPATEASAGRSGKKPPAHPLCEKLKYMTGDDAELYAGYVQQLTQWTESAYSHPKLFPILKYVKSGSILQDLVQHGLIQLNENGRPEKDDVLIRWRVVGLDDTASASCWLDKTLFDAFINWYLDKKAGGERAVCMITGEVEPRAEQHPKGVIAKDGNAKLISANDKSGFTYRGRFSEDWQAATVGYEASQKAHNALRWLAAEQGARAVLGGRTFLCWNPQGVQVCSPLGAFGRHMEPKVKPSDYRSELQNTLNGYRTKLKPTDGVVIAAFDAATTGRLALTYYNELMGVDFLQRLCDWDMHCCWNNRVYGIQSPGLLQIINFAFGTQRADGGKAKKMRADDPVVRQQIQRLIACRVERAKMPVDIVKALVQRASNPEAYDIELWRRMVYIACAVLNKFLFDHGGEDVMSWELNKHDRSFQFGRLLAVMERAEQDFYERIEGQRQTNALKAMSAFRQRPFHIYERVNRQLNQAYLSRIKPWQKQRYERLKGEIIAILQTFPEDELNRPLEDIYLMGYDCQRNAFYQPKEAENKEDI